MIKEELIKNWKTYSGIGLGIIAATCVTSYLFLKKKQNTNKITRESLKSDSGPLDMSKMVNDLSKIELAKKLRDQLRKKVHPDRFVHDELKKAIADDIAKEINEEKNQLTYSKLMVLKEKAERELGIKIDV
jgi:hypothetical protein